MTVVAGGGLYSAAVWKILHPRLAITLLAVLGVYGCITYPATSLQTGTLPEQIGESSALTRSSRNPNLFWTLNDSGNAPEIFAIDLSGRVHATVILEGVANSDWEAMTADGAGTLFVADIGNNENARRDLVIHEIAEPDPEVSGTVPVRRSIRFRFEDQNRYPDPDTMNFDAEAVIWADGLLYILTKHRSDTRTALYVVDPSATGETVARRITSVEIGSMVTDASLSPDHRILAVLTYAGIHLYERSGENFLANHLKMIRFDPAISQQSEGIAWDGANALAFTNEQRAVHHVARPLDPNVTTYP